MIAGEFDPRFEVREIDGGETAVIHLNESYINYSTADVLKQRLKRAIECLVQQGRTRFVLDITNIGLMDSCGLSVIIAVKKYVDGRGGSLALMGLSNLIQRLFAITRLDRAIEVYASEEEAIQAG